MVSPVRVRVSPSEKDLEIGAFSSEGGDRDQRPRVSNRREYLFGYLNPAVSEASAAQATGLRDDRAGPCGSAGASPPPTPPAIEANDEWLVGRSYISQKSMGTLWERGSETDIPTDQEKEVELIAA